MNRNILDLCFYNAGLLVNVIREKSKNKNELDSLKNETGKS